MTQLSVLASCTFRAIKYKILEMTVLVWRLPPGVPGPSVRKNIIEEGSKEGGKDEESCPAESGHLERNETPSSRQSIEKIEKGKQKEKDVVLTPNPRPPLPLPYRLKKKADDTKFINFMAMLKQLTINFPLVEALDKMPGYVKFIKDLVKKKQVVSQELEDILHHYGSMSTRSLVQKKANPGAFTILCTIGSFEFAKVLCDLGESINLMSLAIYRSWVWVIPRPRT